MELLDALAANLEFQALLKEKMRLIDTQRVELNKRIVQPTCLRLTWQRDIERVLRSLSRSDPLVALSRRKPARSSFFRLPNGAV
jgi:hypothetical protein